MRTDPLLNCTFLLCAVALVISFQTACGDAANADGLELLEPVQQAASLVGQDSDNDGVPDEQDQCADSDLDPTVVIDGCDSGSDNILLDDGCTIADLIDAIADSASDHGQFVAGVAHLTTGLQGDELITGAESGDIQKCAARSARPPSPAYRASTWTTAGGPPGGLGYDLRVRPDDRDRMFVTSDGGGAFESRDRGKTWKAINNGITVRGGASNDAVPVFSITLDPNNPDRMWAGTRTASGIFRTDDAGATWTKMNNGVLETDAAFRGFTVHPSNSDIVYAAGEIPSIEWNNGVPDIGPGGVDRTQGMVYRTTDAGANWTRLWRGDSLARYVLIHPTDHDKLWVSIGIFDRNSANSSDTDPGGVGILRSVDGGAHWEVLDSSHGFDPGDKAFGSLVMHPTDPDTLLAAAGLDPYGAKGAIYLTQDGGDHWAKVVDGDNGSGEGQDAMSSVEFCEGHPNVAYASSIYGVWRSLDTGESFFPVAGALWGPPDMAAGFPIDMQCDPDDPDRIFINNYIGGNFLSLDGGVSWTLSSDGYSGASVKDVEVTGGPTPAILATSRPGLFTHPKAGGSWRGLNTGIARNLEGLGIAVDPRDPDHILFILGDTGPDPLETFDGGNTWSKLPTNLFGPGIGDGSIADLVFSPQDADTVFGILTMDYACYSSEVPTNCEGSRERGLAASRDGGTTWSVTSFQGQPVLSIAIDQQSEGPMYLSVYGRGVYRSEDDGQTWQQVNANPLNQPPRTGSEPDVFIKLAVDPFDPEKIYGGFYGAGVAISEDGGTTWSISSTGISPNATVVDFAPDPNREGVVYAGSFNAGVFITKNGGRTWSQHNSGLTNRSVRALALSDDGGVLYAATEKGGVFSLDPSRSE